MALHLFTGPLHQVRRTVDVALASVVVRSAGGLSDTLAALPPVQVAVELKGTGEDITAVTLLASLAERIRHRPHERLGSEVASLLSRALQRSVGDDGSGGQDVGRSGPGDG